jgi:hypothetical protein
MNPCHNVLKQVKETPREDHAQQPRKQANGITSKPSQTNRHQESTAPRATTSIVDKHRECKSTAQSKPRGKSPKTKRISGKVASR